MSIEIETTGNANPKLFGVIGFVIAIFALIFSLIPCVGSYAIIPGILSSIFCWIAFTHAQNIQSKTGLYVAGMIMGILAIVIGIIQYFVFKEVYDAKNEIDNSIEEGLPNAVKDQLMDSIQHETDTTSIDSFEIEE